MPNRVPPPREFSWARTLRTLSFWALLIVGSIFLVQFASNRRQEALELSQRRGVPEWLEVDRPNFTGRIRALPARNDLTMPINEKLVVELYSK